MKNLFFIFIILLVSFSCKNEEDLETDDLTSSQASEVIFETEDDASEDILTFVNSGGSESAFTLLDLMFNSSEFGDIGFRKDEARSRILKISKLFGSSPASRVSTGVLNEFITGVYEWSEIEEDFVFVEESENLVLKFPVEPSETNNAVFTLIEYAFDVNDLPTDIVATITVDEVLMVDIHFRVNWSADSFPETANIYIFVNPFTVDLDFDDTADQASMLLASISIDEEVIAAIDLDIQYETNLKEFPSALEGSVQYRSIKIVGSIDIYAADNGVTDPNEYTDLALHIEDQKVGDIIFVLETEAGEEYYVEYVQYLDGTTELLEDILEGLLEELDVAFEEIFREGYEYD